MRRIIIFLFCLTFFVSCASIAKQKEQNLFKNKFKRESIYNNFDKFKQEFEKANKSDDSLYDFLLHFILSAECPRYVGCFSFNYYKEYRQYVEKSAFNFKYKYFDIGSIAAPSAGLILGSTLPFILEAVDFLELDFEDAARVSIGVPSGFIGAACGSGLWARFNMKDGKVMYMKDKDTTVHGYKYYIGDLIVDTLINLKKSNKKYSDLLETIYLEPWRLEPYCSISTIDIINAPRIEKELKKKAEEKVKIEQEKELKRKKI